MGRADWRVPLWSVGIWRQPLLAELLGGSVERVVVPRGGGQWLGWGAKPSARRAAWYARRAGGDSVQLEDGFIRSYGTGEHFPALSLVVDDRGIYYDSTRPSELEAMLASGEDLLAGMQEQVCRARALLLEHRLSKYNHAPILEDVAGLAVRAGARERVLLVDQTVGDLSVSLGGANENTFFTMLAAARREHPQATIYIKTHPEVSSGRKRGYLSAVAEDERTVLIRGAVNPLSLLEQMDRVYVVSSTMGFEALLAGKPVSVFGLPWYAGWGVSDDRLHCPRRGRQRTVDELFAAAYFHYSRYLNPFTHARGSIFDVFEWLRLQRRLLW